MRIKTLLFFTLAFIGTNCFAQRGSLQGWLKDSATHQPLALASVAVYSAKDTTVIAYGLSDASGSFRLTGLPVALSCRAVITFQGYKVYRREFVLTKERPQLNLDTIRLAEDAKALDEIFVTAERPPVRMHNDTLEFNAGSFKTLPSALVEDLLKKLPGIDVDLEGNITVRGRKVNRLLVDGRTFFGNDLRIATRNLPANIVDKVQVVNDSDEVRRNPLLREGEAGQVVNIKLKSAVRQGWFGRGYAGGGTDSRHEAGAVINRFSDTMQLSFLGHSNNVNKPGFGQEEMYRRSGMSDDDIAVLESRGSGIQHSIGGGLNFNTQWKALSVNLHYAYKETRSANENAAVTQTFLEDTVLTNPSNGSYKTVGKEHSVGLSLNWQIDSTSTLRFDPDVSFAQNNSRSVSESLTADNFKGPVNANNDVSTTTGRYNRISGNLSFNRYSRKKPGRAISVDVSSYSNGNGNNRYEEALYRFYRLGADSALNRFHAVDQPSATHQLSVNLTEPLGKSLELILQHRAQYETETEARDVYDRDASGKYEVYRAALSNGAEKRGWRNTTTASTSWRIKNFTLTPGLNLLWLNQLNTFRKQPDVRQDYFFASPSINLNFGNFGINYSAYLNPPDARELQEVIDVSDPVQKEYGNPALKPSRNQNIGLHYYHFFPNSGAAYHINVNASFQDNATLSQTLLDSNRVEITRPVNVSGVRSYSFNGSGNRQFKLATNVHLSVRPTADVNYNRNAVFVNGRFSTAEYVQTMVRLSVGFNFRDVVECNQRYTLNLNQSRYADKTAFRDADLVTHNAQWEVVVRWPKRIVWEGSAAYNYNSRISAGLRRSTLRLNGAVNYLFLKEDKGQLRLSVYDALNQNVNTYRYADGNSVYEGQSTTLRRYLMLSFIYNLRSFGGASKKRPFVMEESEDE